MRKNNHLIVILFGILIIIGLLYAHISLKYSGVERIGTSIIHNDLLSVNNTLSNNSNEEQNDEEEINLGDIKGCQDSYKKCFYGDEVDGKCQVTSTTPAQYGCLSQCNGPSSGNWNGKCCWGVTKPATETTTVIGTAAEICTNCQPGYYLSGGSCIECRAIGGLEINGEQSVVSANGILSRWCAQTKMNSPQCKSTASDCKNVTNKCGKSTITIGGESISIPVSGNWGSLISQGADGGKVTLDHEPGATTEAQADGKNGHEISDEICYGMIEKTSSDGTKYWECDSYRRRSECGIAPVVLYSYCCVDKQFIGVSSESSGVKWADHVHVNYNQTKNGKSGCAYYFGDNYTHATNPNGSEISQSKCSAPEIINRCTAAPTGLDPKQQETSSCEEEMEINLQEKEECSDNSTSINNSFYSINCNRTIKANFDYGDDEITTTARQLYKGQGFKFGIKLETVIECDKQFFGGSWTKSYLNLLNRIRTIDNTLVYYYENDMADAWVNYINGNSIKFKDNDVKSRVYALWNYLNDLKKIVETYNNHEADSYFNEKATLDFSYKVNGKTVSISSQNPNQSDFTKTIVSEGKYDILSSSTVNLDVEGRKIKGITYPKTMKKSTKNNPRIVKLEPKEMYITKTGTLTYVKNSNYSGGNKIYIDYYTDAPQIITLIAIKVTGYAGKLSEQEGKSIINNKCDITVKDSEIIYRPIDVSNPFINNTWTPGKNWVNSEFDFRNIIKANIWSTSGNYATYTSGKWNKTK